MHRNILFVQKRNTFAFSNKTYLCFHKGYWVIGACFAFCVVCCRFTLCMPRWSGQLLVTINEPWNGNNIKLQPSCVIFLPLHVESELIYLLKMSYVFVSVYVLNNTCEGCLHVSEMPLFMTNTGDRTCIFCFKPLSSKKWKICWWNHMVIDNTLCFYWDKPFPTHNITQLPSCIRNVLTLITQLIILSPNYA